MQKIAHMESDDPGERVAVALLAENEEMKRRIADLKRELDAAHDLIQRLTENIEDFSAMNEQWKEAFEMVMGDNGKWTWSKDFAMGSQWYDKYAALLKEWNQFVGIFNATVEHRNAGRPLEASEAQILEVRRLRKAGMSLRKIAEETSLALSTVRTIVGRDAGTDRTTKRHLERIDDRAAMASWRSRQRTRKALPARITAFEDDAAALLKEVKKR